jgi:hypothetical protein
VALAFHGDAGIYLPAEDGIKLTAFEDGQLREYVVTRAALVAGGADPTMDFRALLEFFERNRALFEVAAANVAPQPSLHWRVRPDDVARGRLVHFAERRGARKV